jgi:hypothetical protein
MMERTTPSRGTGAGDAELRPVLTAMQPLIPSVDGEHGVDHLQPHVGVELGVVEDERIQHDVHDRRRPTPDILADAEVYAQCANDGGDQLEWRHVMIDSGEWSDIRNMRGPVQKANLAFNVIFLGAST